MAALAVIGGLMVPATAAHATASSCTTQRWDGTGEQNGWEAKCSTQSNPDKDQWRGVAVCARDNNPSIKTTAYGPWIGGVGASWSIAHCGSNYSAVSGSFQTRESS